MPDAHWPAARSHGCEKEGVVGALALEQVEVDQQAPSRAGRAAGSRLVVSRGQRIVEILGTDGKLESRALQRPVALELLEGDVDACVVEPLQRHGRAVLAKHGGDVAQLDARPLEQPPVRAGRVLEHRALQEARKALLSQRQLPLEAPARLVDVERTTQERTQAREESAGRAELAEPSVRDRHGLWASAATK